MTISLKLNTFKKIVSSKVSLGAFLSVCVTSGMMASVKAASVEIENSSTVKRNVNTNRNKAWHPLMICYVTFNCKSYSFEIPPW